MSFIGFNEPVASDSGKTLVIGVCSKSEPPVYLGTIKWWGAWRKYAFLPAADMVFDVNCLKDIEAKLTELMAERKKK